MSHRDLARVRYAKILYDLLVWKYLTPEHVSALLDVALPNAYRYIRRLRDLGLVRSDRILGYTLVSLTSEGREFTFDLLPEVDQFRYLYPAYSYRGEAPHNLTHELKVRKVCIKKLKPSISFSVYAKVLAKVYGRDTIGLHRADAVHLYKQDGAIYPVAIEMELSPKKNSKVKEKLKSVAEALGEYYSRVEFHFKRPVYEEKFKNLTFKIGYPRVEEIIRYSNLYGHSYLKPVKIYQEAEKELKHLHKYGSLSLDVWLFKMDENIAKELSRKLR